MSNTSISSQMRRAAFAILLVVPTLAACASDNGRLAMSGSSLPKGSSATWSHTPNEPNWESTSYTGQ